MKKIIILLSLVLSHPIFSQQYNDFAREIFFGRLASAKTEAMGRIVTLNFDPYFVSQSNPANLISTVGVAVFYSNSSPFYGYNDASYKYAGISYNNSIIGALAFNLLLFDTGPTIVIPPGSVPFNLPFKEKRYLYTLTYSNRIKDWFSFGINANLFVADYGTDQKYSDSFFELGLSRYFNLFRDLDIKDDLTIGTQLKNIFNQSFSAIDEAQSDAFPSIFRIGVSNLFEYTDNDIFEKSYLFGFTLGLEYQDVLNSGKRTAYKAGGELSLIDIIFLRGGYYNESIFSSKDELTEFTYGFGTKLDFDKYISNNFPLILLFDFVSLSQPTYATGYDDWDNFTTFNLTANYGLE